MTTACPQLEDIPKFDREYRSWIWWCKRHGIDIYKPPSERDLGAWRLWFERERGREQEEAGT